MRACHLSITVTAILGLVATSTIAATPPLSTHKNQTPQQQRKDAGRRCAWAKQNTGIGPLVWRLLRQPLRCRPTQQTQPLGTVRV
jgi:hypothetical protein